MCWQYQPLEMFRASPARNGFYPARGVPRLTGVRWAFKTWGPVISSPVAVSGWTETVCFGSWDGKLYAVNSLNGRELWSLWTEGEVVSSPAIESGTVFFGSYDGRLYAAQLLTGDLLWRFKTGNGLASSPLITRTVSPGTGSGAISPTRSVYISVGSIDGCLYCLDTRGRQVSRCDTGDPLVSSPAGPVSLAPDSALSDAPGEAIVTVGTKGGALVAVNVKTGRETWRFSTEGSIESSPAVGGGSFYFGSCDHSLYALDASTGRKRWAFETGGAIRSSPALLNDTVFIGSSDHCVHAVDARTGRKKWRFKTGGPVESSPSVANGLLFVGSHDRHLYALDCTSGALLWKLRTGGPVRSSPAVGDGVVYFGSDDGYLYAVE